MIKHKILSAIWRASLLIVMVFLSQVVQLLQGFMYLSLYNTGLYNEMQAVVPPCYTQKQIIMITVDCGGWVEESHSLRKEAALESGGTTVDTSVSLAKRQQGEQAAAGVCVVFSYPFVFIYRYKNNICAKRFMAVALLLSLTWKQLISVFGSETSRD